MLVDHRPPGLHARRLALVDKELLRERIAAGIEHFGRGRIDRDARLELHQPAQPRIFLLDRRVSLHQRRLAQQLRLQGRVVVGQRTLR